LVTGNFKTMNFLERHIEAVIFCSHQPVAEDEIRSVLNEMYETEIPQTDVDICLTRLMSKYENEMYPFEILKSGGGYQFLTKPAYQASIGIYLKQKSKKRLSTTAMETLAIISYKQPISKSQIEQIRGVNCDYSVQKLLEKELIQIKGKAETPGRPVLYGTSAKFMDYFGINSLSELPTPRDLATEHNEIGEVQE
jgi:segregation and condensation protein B